MQFWDGRAGIGSYLSQRTTASSAAGGSLGLMVGAVQTQAWRSDGRSTQTDRWGWARGGGQRVARGVEAWFVGVKISRLVVQHVKGADGQISSVTCPRASWKNLLQHRPAARDDSV